MNRTTLLAAAFAALACLATPARAEPFTIFVYETREDFALRADSGPAGQAYWAEYGAFAAALQSSGAIRGGAPLALPGDAVTIGARGRSNGPVRGRRLALGGYFQIEAADRAAAEALAAQAPAVRRGGLAEVRASYPAPTMTPPR